MNEQIDWKIGDQVSRVSAEHCSSMPMGPGTVTGLSEYPNIRHPIQVDGIHWPHINDIQLIKSATVWNGPEDGLPPVGTVCELRTRNGGWGEAEIKYHGRAVCVWLWVRRDGNTEQVEHAESPDRLEFRPIRTAEQLAAEEREKWAEALFDRLYPGFGWKNCIEQIQDRYRAEYDRSVQP